MAWQGGSAFILQLLTQKWNWEELSLFEIHCCVLFSKHLLKVFLAPSLQVWFWPSTVSPWNNWYVLSSLLCKMRGGEVARRDASGWTQGRILSTRSQVDLWTEAMQTFHQSDPDWKKLGVGRANVRTGLPSSRAPDWSPHGVPSHPRYRRCHFLCGVGRPELGTPRFSFQLCHKFHRLPWAGKPNPHASLLCYLGSSYLSVSPD